MTTKTIAVIGAGIVGVSTALWLLRDGHKVTLIDRDGPAARASRGNAGLLAAAGFLPNSAPGMVWNIPRMLLDPRKPLFLRWSYLPRFLPWGLSFLARCNAADTRRIAAALVPMVVDTLAEHQALAHGTPAARYIRPCDYVYAYDSRAGFEADAASWALKRDLGLEWEELEGDRLLSYDPFYRNGPGFGVRMGGHGRISDPGAYVTALAQAFQAQGGQVIRADVTDVRVEAGRVTGLRAGGDVLPCDDLVICAGAWSGALTRALGYRPPLDTERGYHLELWAPSAMPRSPTMITSGQFVVTPMEGRLRLAGVVEIGGLDAGPSRAPLALLRRELARTMPELRWREMTEWMGHRPSTPDSLPVVGAVPGVAGAWAGFGHQHVGLTAGPKTGRLLAQMIMRRRPNLDMSPYAPDRFG